MLETTKITELTQKYLGNHTFSANRDDFITIEDIPAKNLTLNILEDGDETIFGVEFKSVAFYPFNDMSTISVENSKVEQTLEMLLQDLQSMIAQQKEIGYIAISEESISVTLQSVDAVKSFEQKDCDASDELNTVQAVSAFEIDFDERDYEILGYEPVIQASIILLSNDNAKLQLDVIDETFASFISMTDVPIFSNLQLAIKLSEMSKLNTHLMLSRLNFDRILS